MTGARPFVNPQRVIAAPGASSGVATELTTLGVRPADGAVLVVGDGSVLDLGLDRAVCSALRDAGFTVRTSPPVTGEPTREIVEAGVTAGEDDTVAVIGIGGGSAMDAAKLVAAGLGNDLDFQERFGPDAQLRRGPVLVLIPTTAGTGAEATAVAMLWKGPHKQIFVHAHLVPSLVVLDPVLTMSLPPAVTASGGLDAVSHAVESVLSTFRTPMTTSIATAALTSLVRHLPTAYEDGTAEAREGTLLGAYQAGLALNASVVLGHSIAYTVAARAPLPHGVTCAMALPYCMAQSRPEAKGRIGALADAMGLGDTAGHLHGWVCELNEKMGIPASLEEVGITRDQLPDMAAECLQEYARPNNPTPVTQEGTEELLAHFFTGDVQAAWAASATTSATGVTT